MFVEDAILPTQHIILECSIPATQREKLKNDIGAHNCDLPQILRSTDTMRALNSTKYLYTFDLLVPFELIVTWQIHRWIHFLAGQN